MKKVLCFAPSIVFASFMAFVCIFRDPMAVTALPFLMILFGRDLDSFEDTAP